MFKKHNLQNNTVKLDCKQPLPKIDCLILWKNRP